MPKFKSRLDYYESQIINSLSKYGEIDPVHDWTRYRANRMLEPLRFIARLRKLIAAKHQKKVDRAYKLAQEAKAHQLQARRLITEAFQAKATPALKNSRLQQAKDLILRSHRESDMANEELESFLL